MEEVKEPVVEEENKQPEPKVEYVSAKEFKEFQDKFNKLFETLTAPKEEPKNEPEPVKSEPAKKGEEIDFDTYCYQHFDKFKEKK